MCFELIKGLIHLMRPAEWTKSFGNMLIAGAMVFYLYSVKIDPFLLFQGFASVALLWSSLYTINDYIDRDVDAKHAVKKNRAIPSGRVPANIAIGFAIALMIIAYAIAFSINFLLVICLIVMTINQLLYTLKPIYLKKRAVLDLISGSLINPLFRFYSGWVLFMSAFNAPLLPIIFILGLQFGGYSLYRLSCRKHERELGYKSSAVVFGKALRNFSYLILAIAGASFVAMIAIGKIFVEYKSLFLGFLPGKFFWLVIGSAIMLPSYRHALKDPQQTDMQKMYRLLYIHYLLFILGFVIALYLDNAFVF